MIIKKAISAASTHITELERLKQELQIRNKLNEQQAKKIIAQQENFNKKQVEVLALDKRIEELKERIASKRNHLIQSQFNNGNGINTISADQNHHALPQQYQQPQQPQPHNHLASLRVNNQAPGMNIPVVNDLVQSSHLQQQQQQQQLNQR